MTKEAVRLRPLTSAEFDVWLPRQVAGYAEMIANSGALPVEAAREKAVRDTTGLLSGGVATPGHVLLRILAAEAAVGWLWLGVPGPDPDPRMAWVYDIEIAPEFRGRGYGRAAMLLAEDAARARGMTSLGLNVHGQNQVARSLYADIGYRLTTLQLKKPL